VWLGGGGGGGGGGVPKTPLAAPIEVLPYATRGRLAAVLNPLALASAQTYLQRLRCRDASSMWVGGATASYDWLLAGTPTASESVMSAAASEREQSPQGP